MTKNANFLIFMLLGIMSIILITLIFILLCTNVLQIHLALFLVAYLTITLFYIVLERKKIINIKTIFVAMYTIMIGLSPLFYYLKNNSFNFSNGTLIEYQYYYIILSYIIMLLGFYFPTKKKEVLKENDEKRIEFNKFFGIMLSLVSMFFNIYYIYKNKSFLLGGNLNEGRISALSSNGIILVLTSFYLAGIGFLYNYYIETKKSKLLLLFFVSINVVFFLIRGNRSQVVNIFIVIILIRNHYRPIKPQNMLKLFAIALLSISLLQVIRNNFSGSNSSLLDATYDTLQVGSINLNYIYNTFPKKYNFQYGATFLTNIKMMLPGPDLDFTLWLKKCIGVEFAGGGVTPTIIGEGYINLGVIGIIIIMFFTGLIGNILDKAYNSNEKNIVFISCVIINIISVFRGGYANIEIGLLVVLFLYFVYNILYGQNKKRRILNVKDQKSL